MSEIYSQFTALLEEKKIISPKYNAIIEIYRNLEELAKDFPEDVQAERNEIEKKIYSYMKEILIPNTSPFLMEIKCGTGGLDAQDWTEILMTMYLKYFQKHNLKTEILSIQQEVSGIRGALLKVNGVMEDFLCEEGVHRLVRISPFNAQNKRQTSFASVQLIPFQPESYAIEIDKKDLKIDTYRASGAGGQHVNKTESAVRITHIPTNTVVQCQTEKSQIQNRETAMAVLRAKLQVLKKEELTPERKIFSNSWSGHFRSYVFDPYKLIKDTRLDYEINNATTINSFLNGQISPFLSYYNERKIQFILNSNNTHNN